jgi:hypothetical protein
MFGYICLGMLIIECALRLSVDAPPIRLWSILSVFISVGIAYFFGNLAAVSTLLVGVTFVDYLLLPPVLQFGVRSYASLLGLIGLEGAICLVLITTFSGRLRL